VSQALAAGRAEVRVDAVPVPFDCIDGFGEAFYARPEAFLRPDVRAATSGFGLADPAAVQRGLERLEHDLASGAWDRLYGHWRERDQYDGAMRLITAHP
jgi:hypothetical protein